MDLPNPHISEMNAEIRILYRNYRGETAVRRVVPERIWFGGTEWHPEKQWLMDAVDLDKNATRSFALRDVLSFDVASETHVSVGR